jgi:Bacterial Ig domain
MRSRRRLGIALAVLGLSMLGAGLTSAAVRAAAPQVKLQVSDTHPPQFRGITLQAVTSDPSVTFYVFVYGDGIVETSHVPLASHGYARPGTYQAKVAIVNASHATAVSAPVTIHVRDGVPPTVSITSPGPAAHVSLGKSGYTLRGQASDAGGVRRVDLAIQLVASKRHFATHGGCVWYDPRLGLVLANCQTPVFVRTRFSHNRWSFLMPPRPPVTAGSYVVRVRATDRAGNVSGAYSERLRTIIPFTLTP